MINPDLFQSVFNNLDSGLLVFDAVGKLSAWNPRVKLLLDLDDHVLKSLSYKDDFRLWLEKEMLLAERETAPQHHSRGNWIGSDMLFRHFSAAAKGIPSVFQVQVSSGKIFRFQGHAIPDGGFSLVVTDQTETEQLRSDRDLSKLRYDQSRAIQDRVMSTSGRMLQHALQQVIGSMDQMTRREHTAIDGNLARDSLASSERIVDALNAIMDFVNVETGKLDLSTDLFDLQAVSIAAIRAIQEKTGFHDEEKLKTDIGNLPQVKIRGDAGRLRQLMELLVCRMAHYCSDGTLDLRLGMTEETADKIVFSFDLSGQGRGLTLHNNDVMRNLLSGTFQPEDIHDAESVDMGLIVARSILEALEAEMTVVAANEYAMQIRFDCVLRKGQDIDYQNWLGQAEYPGQVLVLDGQVDRCAETARWLQSKGLDVLQIATSDRLEKTCRDLLQTGTPPACITLYDDALGHEAVLRLAKTITDIYDLNGIDAVAPMLLISPIGVRGENARLAREGVLGHLIGNISASTLMFAIRATQHQANIPKQDRLLINRFNLSESIPPDFSVLVVDDNEVNRDIGKSLMEKEGCAVTTANDGLDALNKCRERHFDLVLMDIQMPQMDGVTATRHIRNISHHHAAIPIIAVTSNSSTEDARLYQDAGLNGLMPKPVVSEKLLAMGKQLVSTTVRGEQGSWFTDDLLWAKTNAMIDSETPVQVVTQEQSPTEKNGEAGMSETKNIVNIDLLSGLRSDLGDEILKELIDAFLGDIDNHSQALTDAMTVPDLEKLEIAAHTIKGMAGNLGVDRVFSVSQDVVTQCRQGNAGESVSEATKLLDLIEEANTYIKGLDLSSI